MLNKPVPELPQKERNLFFQLAENVTKTLKVHSCYVCEGTTMGDQWPWEAREAVPADPVPNVTYVEKGLSNSLWILKTSIIRQYCLAGIGRGMAVLVGKLDCLGQKLHNGTSGLDPPRTPPGLGSTFWHILDMWAQGLYQTARPVDGQLCPWHHQALFLLPIKTGDLLDKQSLVIGDWKYDEWPPERIIQYYGPATWAEDDLWGYYTPIHMLDQILRLQTVLEILTNKTGQALIGLAWQETKLRKVIYQNKLALDYLPAAERGVCGKFHLTNCCLQIDDQGQVVENIVRDMTKLAHLPTQVWHGFDPESMFGNWFPAIGGLKNIII
ncbi:Endogenous retrovirus group 3 member 1 Env polyprotein, partial [Plecturocebus cupreus]